MRAAKSSTSPDVEQNTRLQELVVDVSRMLQDSRDRHEPHLSPSQRRVLCLLGKHGPITQQRLLDELELAPASLSELLTKLEREGLVAREKSSNDRRSVIISLTQKGRPIAKELITSSNARAHEVFKSLSQSEKQQLEHLLAHVQKNWMPAFD